MYLLSYSSILDKLSPVAFKGRKKLGLGVIQSCGQMGNFIWWLLSIT